MIKISKLKNTIKIAGLLSFIVCFFAIDSVYANQTTKSVLGDIPSVFGYNLWELFNQILAQFFFQLQTIASWLIIMAGYLLNFSINLTLNIKAFVDNTPAIFTTWKALRDISGMFIIFFLLYAAIQLILGIEKPNFGNLIKNIVLAGVLINFSFFFAGLGIDASNLVSVQLYNAIAPKSSLNSANISADKAFNSAADGGLSDIFMSALKIPALYDVTGQRTTAGQATGAGTWTQPVHIMLYGVTSIMIMVTAAFSFGFAALMFIARFVILLFLLAFSPIWFMSFLGDMSEEVSSYTKKWKEYYKNMLLIMPIYLLLMYMSLNVLTSQNFFGNPRTSTDVTATSGSGEKVASDSLVNTVLAKTTANKYEDNSFGRLIELAINAVLVIFMMNIPLIGAISIGGKATGWLKAENFGAGAIWKKVSTSVGSYTGRNTLGAGAAALNKSSIARSLYANSPSIGRYVSSGLGKVSSYGFGGGKKAGYDQVRKEKIREYKEIAEKSNYTNEEAIALATKEISSGADKKYRELGKNAIDQHRELTSLNQKSIELRKKLNQEKDPDKKELISKEIDETNRMIELKNKEKNETKNAMDSREKDLAKEITKRRQENIASYMEKQTLGRKIASKVTGGKFGEGGSTFGKDVAKAIRKEKSTADQIMDIINKEKGDKDGDKEKNKDKGGEKKGDSKKS